MSIALSHYCFILEDNLNKNVSLYDIPLCGFASATVLGKFFFTRMLLFISGMKPKNPNYAYEPIMRSRWFPDESQWCFSALLRSQCQVQPKFWMWQWPVPPVKNIVIYCALCPYWLSSWIRMLRCHTVAYTPLVEQNLELIPARDRCPGYCRLRWAVGGRREGQKFGLGHPLPPLAIAVLLKFTVETQESSTLGTVCFCEWGKAWTAHYQQLLGVTRLIVVRYRQGLLAESTPSWFYRTSGCPRAGWLRVIWPSWAAALSLPWPLNFIKSTCK